MKGCRLFKQCQNLLAGHFVAGEQAVKAVSEPTCRALRSAGCLSGFKTYLPGDVLQWSRLFKWCLNLRAEHRVEGVKAAEAVLEPTCRELCCKGAGCLKGYRLLSAVRT